MIVLDGDKLSEKILERISKEIRTKQLKLKLSVFLVGDSSVSRTYINKKAKFCKSTGVDFELLDYPANVEESVLKEKIKETAADDNVSGIVVQLPLPKNFNTQEILNLIPAGKDIDVLSEAGFDGFSKNKSSVIPPVVGAVKYLLDEYGISMSGKKIILIGKGRLAGKPLSMWLLNIGADFSVVDKNTTDMPDFTKKADIIISGVGLPCLVKKDMVKEGAILIDVGTASEVGKIKGDIDPLAYQLASYVAPVPGGVGPVAVAVLVENLLKLYNNKLRLCHGGKI